MIRVNSKLTKVSAVVSELRLMNLTVDDIQRVKMEPMIRTQAVEVIGNLAASNPDCKEIATIHTALVAGDVEIIISPIKARNSDGKCVHESAMCSVVFGGHIVDTIFIQPGDIMNLYTGIGKHRTFLSELMKVEKVYAEKHAKHSDGTYKMIVRMIFDDVDSHTRQFVSKNLFLLFVEKICKMKNVTVY